MGGIGRPDGMTIQQLKYVVKIAECGSITEAARRLFISQPSLSAAVKELEEEFGLEIFYRTARGVSLSAAGSEFLSYARQITELSELLQERWLSETPPRRLCSVSTQHYSFAVNAFVNMILSMGAHEYEFTLRETRTYEIIEDVAEFRSEVGVLYLSEFNRKVLTKLIRERHLVFYPLFDADPHVFISASHPLAGCTEISLDMLEDYPFLTFEQGSYNSFYFSEEILSAEPRKKVIRVTDRATLFNLLIGLNGYTVCTGILDRKLNGSNILSVRLQSGERMCVGYLLNEKTRLSVSAARYIEELKKLVPDSGAQSERCEKK